LWFKRDKRNPDVVSGWAGKVKDQHGTGEFEDEFEKH
jgi:hypothetical protein